MQDTSQNEDSNTSKTDNQSSQETGGHARKTIDVIAETVNQFADVLSWVGNRLTSGSNSQCNIEDARGAKAEVSVSIPADGVGEVTVVLGNMRKSYPAKAVRPEQEFRRGTKVRVADVGISTMFVDCF
jgi:hypothetical protein